MCAKVIHMSAAFLHRYFFICEISVLYSTYNYTILYYNSIFILFAVILTFPTKVLCINALAGREE